MNAILYSSIFFHGLERTIICIGAIISIYLGYKLYRLGVGTGLSSQASYDSKLFGKLMASGKGPGLFLIAFGAFILITALFTGVATSEKKISQPGNATPLEPPQMLEEKQLNELERLRNLNE